MRRKNDQHQAASQNYRRFAYGIVGLAVLVGLFTADQEAAPSSAIASGPGAAQVSDTVAVVPVKFNGAGAHPKRNFAAYDDSEITETPGDSASPATSGQSQPPLPGDAAGAAAPAAPGAAAAGATTEQTGRLVASSRARSGGIAQGDETAARPYD